MEDRNTPLNYSDYTVVQDDTRVVAKKFMANVFLWMSAALMISAFTAYFFAGNPQLLQYLVNANGRGLNLLGYAVMLAPIGFVLTMSLAFNRLSYGAILGLFLLYSAINGISFSFILLAYTAGSIVTCFASAAGMFGVMAIMGYTTNKDLTGFGSIMIMGLFGIIIASLINWFIGSEQLNYIISIIGVCVFTGLTAYDVQKLKRIGTNADYVGGAAATTGKLAVMGALSLYLDFINLFLMLLRLFGKRK